MTRNLTTMNVRSSANGLSRTDQGATNDFFDDKIASRAAAIKPMISPMDFGSGAAAGSSPWRAGWR